MKESNKVGDWVDIYSVERIFLVIYFFRGNCKYSGTSIVLLLSKSELWNYP